MIRSDIHAQNADPNKMACRDCIYRDRDTMQIDGNTVQTGVMRGTCLIFDGKRGRWKPNNVYFMNEKCPMYVLDETEERFWDRKGENICRAKKSST